MQQDSKLEGWEVVSQKKEKELYFHTFEAFFGKPEKSGNAVNPVTVSAILLSKESQFNIFKQQLYFMKREKRRVRGTSKFPKA